MLISKQALRNLARCLLLQGKLSEAKERAQETIEICHRINERQIANMASLVLAEVYLRENKFSECERELAAIEATDPSSDFFVLGNIQRIRGLLFLQEADEELAVHHFSRSLTIFETAEDVYHTALAHYLLGKTIAHEQPDRARNHLISANEIFRKLGVKLLAAEIESLLERLKLVHTPKKRVSSASSQLLMLRLAEATASRELLFRELVAVLQQESRAQKIIVADVNEQKRFYPFITHGYVPNESMGLVAKVEEAQQKDNLDVFAKTKNVQVFPLRAPNAAPALLIIAPASGAVLNDDSSFQPLLRVVELGMDVCALRDKDKSTHSEQDTSAFTSQSLIVPYRFNSP